ncbi:hypothetical protein MUK42_05323 [Musa troglodytarum]|uniref:Uncharacterized protein n=1 Tax=Musa troglodytarum TaxID=320322 RepID=A0A9E7G9K7_9LILI|nr:hypothetical protein MUK42_05323 [Musa troglodytarum]
MNTNHNLSIARWVLVLFIFVVYVVKFEANKCNWRILTTTAINSRTVV